MSSPFHLHGEGRVALVTGGASGLGRAVAEVFAEAGYRPVLADVDAEAGGKAGEELAAAGHEAFFVVTDVADPAQAEAAVKAAVDHFGRLDVVVNNAGIAGRGAPIEDLEDEELQRVLAVNLEGPFRICRHAVATMRQNGGGVIINLSSITAERGSADWAPYAASKAGVIALTRGLARRSGRYNIRVNCLHPGSIEGTALMQDERRRWNEEDRRRRELAKIRNIPLGRAARPRDVAHVALFLASPLAAHVHGAVWTVDGGESLGFQ